MLPGMIEVIVRIVAAGIVADPLAVGADVMSVGMAGLVGHRWQRPGAKASEQRTNQDANQKERSARHGVPRFNCDEARRFLFPHGPEASEMGNPILL